MSFALQRQRGTNPRRGLHGSKGPAALDREPDRFLEIRTQFTSHRHQVLPLAVDQAEEERAVLAAGFADGGDEHGRFVLDQRVNDRLGCAGVKVLPGIEPRRRS